MSVGQTALAGVRLSQVAGQFAGGRFDGMIDLAYGVEHILLPDGSVTLANDPGTYGNGGSNPPHRGTTELGEIVQGARRVHFGANYVFCERSLSESAHAAVVGYIEAHGQNEGNGRWGVGYAGRWMDGDLDQVVWKLSEALSDPEQVAAHLADKLEYPDGNATGLGALT
jgi:hypothetical protein